MYLLPMLSRADPAYFRIGDASGSSIVVRVDQAAAIERAREALAGRSGPGQNRSRARIRQILAGTYLTPAAMPGPIIG